MSTNNIQVGIVGSGFGTRVLLPCFSAVQGVKVTALCSRTPDAVRDVALQYDVPYLFNSLDSMLLRENMDLVCIATPPFLHFSMASTVLNTGKHLLCEKPLALNVEETQKLLHIAEKSNSLKMIDHQLRFHPNRKKIKLLLDDGVLGEIHHIQLSYMTATRLDETKPWDWWSNIDQGGGQLNALGSHQIDMLRWWFGDVKSVQGNLKTFTNERYFPEEDIFCPVTSDEYVSFDLIFENNITASVVLSSVTSDEPGIHIRIVGKKGSLVLDGDDCLLLLRGKSIVDDISEPDTLSSEPVIGLNTWRTSLVRFATHIAGSIRGIHPYEGATFYDGHRTQEVLDAVRYSCKQNRLVDVKELRKM